MNKAMLVAVLALSLTVYASPAAAAPAVQVLGRDFSFPQQIEGMPSKLSDVSGLQINSFVTKDGVQLAYWEAGAGEALVFVPGWSGNGAQYINLIALLYRHYHVYVLDPRNQGLSQRVAYGRRIACYAVDLREFSTHIGVKQASFVGHSMGAAVLWSYIDLFGTQDMRKLVFVDEPISIYAHSDWSEKERSEAGGSITSAERMVSAFAAGEPVSRLTTDMKPFERVQLLDSPYFANSESFSAAVVTNDVQAMGRVLFDHVMNDWRDVVQHKIDVPVAVFSGEESNNLPSQRWVASVVPEATFVCLRVGRAGRPFPDVQEPA